MEIIDLMKRREFFLGAGATLAGSNALVSRLAHGQTLESALKAVEDPYEGLDLDSRGGYTTEPQRQYLFTDLRHIEVGDLSWFSPQGNPLPVAGPPDPHVAAYAETGFLPRGIRLQAFPAVKEGPLDQGPPGTIHYVEGRYRAWNMFGNYPAGKDLGSYSTTSAESLTIKYYESDDGYQWREKHSFVMPIRGQTGMDGPCFFIDPQGAPGERYKLLYHAMITLDRADIEPMWREYVKRHPYHRDVRLTPGHIRCLFGAVSPDGLSWRALEKPLMLHFGDTDNSVYFDEWLGRYVLYTRLFLLNRRLIVRATSEDFRHWSSTAPMIWSRLGDSLSEDIYTNCRTAYHGLPGYHFMFPLFYERLTQGSSTRIFSSYNGIMWDEIPGGPVATSDGPGAWEGEFAAARPHLVPLGGEKIGVSYVGVAYPHKYPRWPGVTDQKTGWLTWPQGRIAGVIANQEGAFYTFALPVAGRRLRVNARVRRAGELRIGLTGNQHHAGVPDLPLDLPGRSVADADPLWGDSLAHPVTWKGDSNVGRPLGDMIRLHFKMRAAEVYGFEWV